MNSSCCRYYQSSVCARQYPLVSDPFAVGCAALLLWRAKVLKETWYETGILSSLCGWPRNWVCFEKMETLKILVVILETCFKMSATKALLCNALFNQRWWSYLLQACMLRDLWSYAICQWELSLSISLWWSVFQLRCCCAKSQKGLLSLAQMLFKWALLHGQHRTNVVAPCTALVGTAGTLLLFCPDKTVGCLHCSSQNAGFHTSLQFVLYLETYWNTTFDWPVDLKDF